MAVPVVCDCSARWGQHAPPSACPRRCRGLERADTQGTVVSSVSGTKWTEPNTPTSSGLESVAFGNGRFVAVGFKGTILYSDNGQRWLTAKSGTTEWLNDVTFGDRRFIIAGRAGLILESGQLTAPPEPPTLTAALAKGGKPRLVIAGQAGQLYRVEVSSDLRQWRVLKLIEGVAEPVEFVDESAMVERDHFYRTVTP